MDNPVLPENSPPRWREDFPIRWENDNYVTRRDLIKFLTLGSLLLVGANVVIAVLGKLWQPDRYPRVVIARAADLSPHAPVLFRYPTDRDACILVRAADGKPHAFSQVCTHLSCAVTYRADRGDLYCPCHVGVFQVSDGRPIAGPPSRPLPRILIDEQDGHIYAVGVEES
jgi:nitrite reductase/ring-hydroxylating ferredoxin subunit